MQSRKLLMLLLFIGFILPTISHAKPQDTKCALGECDPYTLNSDENTEAKNDYKDDYDNREDPFLWGNDEDDVPENQEPYWPGKRQDSFYDYLTR